MQAVFQRWNGPVHVVTAHGMGRAYVAKSQFGWRTAPGILDCHLWSELNDGAHSAPAAALITDLGNDLVYGRSASEIVQAAHTIIARLHDANSDCRIVVTRPPLASVESLSRLRFGLFRTAFFPLCRLSLENIVDASRELDDGIQQLDRVTVVSQRREWFGADPIHIRRRFREAAFAKFLESWPVVALEERGSDSIPFKRPAMGIRWILGRKRVSRQPSVVTELGTVSAW